MSIKSQRNNLDLSNMTMERQRAPNYGSKRKSMPVDGQIDNLSRYVERNLERTVKTRKER